MELGARYRLRGTITSVKLGIVMADVTIRIGENEIAATILRRSAEALGLKPGDEATAVVNASDVSFEKQSASE